MANLGSLLYQIGADTSGLRNSVRDVERTAGQMTSSLDRVTSSADKMGKSVHEATSKMRSDMDSVAREARRIWDQTRTPLERYRAEIVKLNAMYKAGALDLDTYRRALQQTKDQLRSVTSETKNAAGGLGQLLTSAKGVAGLMVGGMGIAMVVAKLKEFSIQLVSTSVQLESTGKAFQAIFGSAQAASNEFQYIKRVSKELGLEMMSVAQAYKGISAAAKGTVLEGVKTRDIFRSVVEAGAALRLSSDEVQGSLYAVSQMISKGAVQAEELRGQLGERLPGAFQMAAQAMGTTTEGLGKMLERGEVVATDMLPKLAKVLHERYGDSAAAGADSAQASFNRFSNALVELAEVAGPPILSVLSALTEAATAVVTGIGAAITKAKEAAATAADISRQGGTPFSLEGIGAEDFAQPTAAMDKYEQTLARFTNQLKEYQEVLATGAAHGVGLVGFILGSEGEAAYKIDQAKNVLNDLINSLTEYRVKAVEAGESTDRVDAALMSARSTMYEFRGSSMDAGISLGGFRESVELTAKELEKLTKSLAKGVQAFMSYLNGVAAATTTSTIEAQQALARVGMSAKDAAKAEIWDNWLNKIAEVRTKGVEELTKAGYDLATATKMTEAELNRLIPTFNKERDALIKTSNATFDFQESQKKLKEGTKGLKEGTKGLKVELEDMDQKFESVEKAISAMDDKFKDATSSGGGVDEFERKAESLKKAWTEGTKAIKRSITEMQQKIDKAKFVDPEIEAYLKRLQAELVRLTGLTDQYAAAVDQAAAKQRELRESLEIANLGVEYARLTGTVQDYLVAQNNLIDAKIAQLKYQRDVEKSISAEAAALQEGIYNYQKYQNQLRATGDILEGLAEGFRNIAKSQGTMFDVGLDLADEMYNALGKVFDSVKDGFRDIEDAVEGMKDAILAALAKVAMQKVVIPVLLKVTGLENLGATVATMTGGGGIPTTGLGSWTPSWWNTPIFGGGAGSSGSPGLMNAGNYAGGMPSTGGWSFGRMFGVGGGLMGTGMGAMGIASGNYMSGISGLIGGGMMTAAALMNTIPVVGQIGAAITTLGAVLGGLFGSSSDPGIRLDAGKSYGTDLFSIDYQDVDVDDAQKSQIKKGVQAWFDAWTDEFGVVWTDVFANVPYDFKASLDSSDLEEVKDMAARWGDDMLRELGGYLAANIFGTFIPGSESFIRGLTGMSDMRGFDEGQLTAIIEQMFAPLYALQNTGAYVGQIFLDLREYFGGAGTANEDAVAAQHALGEWFKSLQRSGEEISGTVARVIGTLAQVPDGMDRLADLVESGMNLKDAYEQLEAMLTTTTALVAQPVQNMVMAAMQTLDFDSAKTVLIEGIRDMMIEGIVATFTQNLLNQVIAQMFDSLGGLNTVFADYAAGNIGLGEVGDKFAAALEAIEPLIDELGPQFEELFAMLEKLGVTVTDSADTVSDAIDSLVPSDPTGANKVRNALDAMLAAAVSGATWDETKEAFTDSLEDLLKKVTADIFISKLTETILPLITQLTTSIFPGGLQGMMEAYLAGDLDISDLQSLMAQITEGLGPLLDFIRPLIEELANWLEEIGSGADTANDGLEKLNNMIKGYEDIVASNTLSEYELKLRDLNQWYEEQMKSIEDLGESAEDTARAVEALNAAYASQIDAMRSALSGGWQDIIDQNTLSDVGLQIKQLNDWYEEQKAAALALGMSIDNLTAAYELQMDALREQYTSSWQDIVDRGTMGDLEYQMHKLNQWYAEQAAAARELGLSVDMLTQAYQVQMQAIIDSVTAPLAGIDTSDMSADEIMEQIQALQALGDELTLDQLQEMSQLLADWWDASTRVTDNMDDAADYSEQIAAAVERALSSVQDTIRNIKYSELNVGVPRLKAEEAGQDYATLLEAALGGDEAAVNKFLQFAPVYLKQMQAAYKSSDTYTEAYDRVMRDLEAVGEYVTSEDYQALILAELEKQTGQGDEGIGISDEIKNTFNAIKQWIIDMAKTVVDGPLMAIIEFEGLTPESQEFWRTLSALVEKYGVDSPIVMDFLASVEVVDFGTFENFMSYLQWAFDEGIWDTPFNVKLLGKARVDMTFDELMTTLNWLKDNNLLNTPATLSFLATLGEDWETETFEDAMALLQFFVTENGWEGEATMLFLTSYNWGRTVTDLRTAMSTMQYIATGTGWDSPATLRFISTYDWANTISSFEELMDVIRFVGAEAGWESDAVLYFLSSSDLWSSATFEQAMSTLKFLAEEAGWGSDATVSFMSNTEAWSSATWEQSMDVLKFSVKGSGWGSDATVSFLSNAGLWVDTTFTDKMKALKFVSKESGWSSDATVSFLSNAGLWVNTKFTDKMKALKFVAKEAGWGSDATVSFLTNAGLWVNTKFTDKMKALKFVTKEAGWGSDATVSFVTNASLWNDATIKDKLTLLDFALSGGEWKTSAFFLIVAKMSDTGVPWDNIANLAATYNLDEPVIASIRAVYDYVQGSLTWGDLKLMLDKAGLSSGIIQTIKAELSGSVTATIEESGSLFDQPIDVNPVKLDVSNGAQITMIGHLRMIKDALTYPGDTVWGFLRDCARFTEWEAIGRDPGYATGGIATGPISGYTTTLHGTEAIIPLGRGELPLRILDGGSRQGATDETVELLREQNTLLKEKMSRPINVTVEVGGKSFTTLIQRTAEDVRVRAEERGAGKRRQVY